MLQPLTLLGAMGLDDPSEFSQLRHQLGLNQVLPPERGYKPGRGCSLWGWLMPEDVSSLGH